MDDAMLRRRDELAAAIAHHNRRYWELGEPEISDVEYDALMRELAAIDPAHPLLTAVNAPAVAGSGKVHHATPLLSLDKAYSLDEIIEWAKKYARTPDELLLIEPKYDGISANYSDRVLATRGDGVDGENISDKLPLIELEAAGYRGPLNRPARGEIVIRDDDFRNLYSHIQKKGGGLYKNSRNAVAGLMGLKEIGDMLAQGAKLTLVDYDLVSIPVSVEELPKRWGAIVEDVETLPYPMDGLVVKLADSAYADSLGSTSHHPRGAMAYKFTNLRAETKLLDVEWSFGKNCLTPVAILEPVELGGVTIKRASLHNIQNILDRDIEVGDFVTVERAGDVIPYIVAAAPGEHRQSALISHCPGCGARLERRGPEICCPDPECKGTRLQQLTAAVKNIGIENLGEPTIRQMMDKLGVRTLSDIFRLTGIQLLQLGGFAEKSVKNLLADLARARTTTPAQVLAALNIPGVGYNIAKLLLEGRNIAELRQMTAEQLAEIKGIGPERAKALVTCLQKDAALLDDLLNSLSLTADVSGGDRPTICFTGKMPEKRSFYEKLARDKGYEPVSAVTRTLALLVTAESDAKSDKARKAAEYGVTVQTLDDFLQNNAVATGGEGAGQLETPDLFG